MNLRNKKELFENVFGYAIEEVNFWLFELVITKRIILRWSKKMNTRRSGSDGISLDVLIWGQALSEIREEILKSEYEDGMLVMQGHDGILRFSTVENDWNLTLDPNQENWIRQNLNKGGALTCGQHKYPIVEDRYLCYVIERKEIL